MAWEFKPQPETAEERRTHDTRMSNLISMCDGNKEKETNKAKRDASKITTAEKAYNRAFAAKRKGEEIGRDLEHVFEAFYERAYELGKVVEKDGVKEIRGVGMAEHRVHVIEKILKKKK